MSQEFIPYFNFRPQNEKIRDELKTAFLSVIDSGQYILGPEVDAFEKEVASYCGTKYAVGVSNGTSALILALKALGIGPGDEVITATNSFISSATAIVMCGAKLVLAEAGDDINIDVQSIEKKITTKTKAIMPVHMAGRACQMDLIMALAKKHNLKVVEDCAQSVGATYKGQKVGSFGDIGCFSMHPLKNLHAYGDAGFISTNNQELADQVKLLRAIGLKTRENCVVWSGNERLDELQAALVRICLRNLDSWTKEKRTLAFRYNELLKPYVQVPIENKNEFHVYQTYVIQAKKRDELFAHMLKNGVDIKIHYPKAIHEQTVCLEMGFKKGDFPATEALCGRIMSLPLYPGMTEAQQDRVINAIRTFYESSL